MLFYEQKSAISQKPDKMKKEHLRVEKKTKCRHLALFLRQFWRFRVHLAPAPWRPFGIQRKFGDRHSLRQKSANKGINTLIKMNRKLSSYIGKFRVEQLQSHI
jgi:hypothetical protein